MRSSPAIVCRRSANLQRQLQSRAAFQVYASRRILIQQRIRKREAQAVRGDVNDLSIGVSEGHGLNDRPIAQHERELSFIRQGCGFGWCGVARGLILIAWLIVGLVRVVRGICVCWLRVGLAVVVGLWRATFVVAGGIIARRQVIRAAAGEEIEACVARRRTVVVAVSIAISVATRSPPTDAPPAMDANIFRRSGTGTQIPFHA